ncbi:MAG TPA: CheR family methyltransferase [Polyangia bacterium]|jgi:chemotaxis protein methyltransferase CheR|nr:CheR family methyltransferase [Polyangia bacterium]
MSSLATSILDDAPGGRPGDGPDTPEPPDTPDTIDRVFDRIESESGIDLGIYDQATLVRRLWTSAGGEGVATPDALDAWLASDPAPPSRLTRLVLGLTSRSAPLFSEVALWSALRARVIPLLRTYPSINVWVPGCGAGTMAYALAMVLHEEGLRERARIYATDLTEMVLEQGRSGRLMERMLVGAAAAYAASGGKASLETYVMEEEGRQVFAPLLRERITFAQHSLATDASFNEFQFILCRDVLASFEPGVAQRGYRLLHESVCRFGIVALGTRDRPPGGWRDGYEDFDMTHQLFRRIV